MVGTRRSGGRAPTSRGQMLQDFTIGIGVFLLALAAVLAGFFGFLQPFETGVDSEDVTQSTRVADTMVQNLSRDQRPNELNVSRTAATFAASNDQLRQRWGLDNSTNFNITVETLDGDRLVTAGGVALTAGTTHHNRTTGSVTRIVTMSDGTCDPSCRLTIRTW